MTKNEKALLLAALRGYKVTEEGELISPTGYKPKLKRTKKGYLYHTISIRYFKNRNCHLKVHQLQAFQIFGSVVFEKDKCVRHLDGNPENNRRSNIAVGTASDNMMDVPKKERIQKARVAAKRQRKFSDGQIKKF